MSSVRLSKATKTLNISLDRAVEELAKNGHDIPNNRNTKISEEQYEVLRTAFADDLERKKAAEEVSQQGKEEKETLRGTPKDEEPAEPVVEVEPVKDTPKAEEEEKPAEEVPVPEEAKPAETKEKPAEEAIGELKVMGKIDLDATKPKKKPKKEEPAPEKKSHKPTVKAPKKSAGGAKLQEQAPTKKEETKPEDVKPEDAEHQTKYVKIDGPKFTGQKIELPVEKPKTPKKKRTRIKTQGPGKATPVQTDPRNRNQRGGNNQNRGKGKGRRNQPVVEKQELSDEEIQKQIKETLEKLTSGKKNKGAKIRRDKRAERREKEELADMQAAEDSKVLQVTEFVTVTELANMMEVSVNDVIASLMGVGVMVTMNQRLDAEMLEM
ncbi:MAG: translation initiation factor IF-2, partial [Bacteroidetes bacterium]